MSRSVVVRLRAGRTGLDVGVLQVRGVNGQIRAQDTIEPGNDPRSSRG